METMIPLRKTLAQFFRRQPPPPPPPNSPVESPEFALPIQQPLPLPNAPLPRPQNNPPDLAPPIQQPLPLPNAQPNLLDFSKLTLTCLTGAVEIAAHSPQNRTDHPMYFQVLCLTVVLAFTSIFVAKYIAAKQPNAARVLNNVGVFFGVTAFFFAVTISFPLGLRIISWIIYGLSLLAILICNRS